MQRNYPCKDVDMLMAGLIICTNFKKYKQQLTTMRPIWGDPFIDDFEKVINTAIKDYLGADTVSQQKTATQNVYSLHKKIMELLNLFKIQIDTDFAYNKEQRKWILDTLGFTLFFNDAKRNNQEALTQLLSRFTKNMDDELKTKISDKGIDISLIDTILSYPEIFKEANIKQEALKIQRKELTAEAQMEFNRIYMQVIGICKISMRIFNYSPQAKRNFTFSHIVNTMNSSGKLKVKDEVENI